MANPQLTAFEADQRRRNEDDRCRVFGRSKYASAVMAPMPEDSTVCRWCGGRLKALLPGGPADFCQQLCAPNDVAPYLGQCATCGRNFETGKHRAVECHECESKTRDEMAEVARVDQTTRYAKHDYTDWMGRK